MERDFWNLASGDAAVIRARPTAVSSAPAAPLVSTVQLTNGREGLLHVPALEGAGQRSALLVILHGAGSTAQRALDRMFPPADVLDAIVFAPQSRAPTWDLLAGGYGPDVRAIDDALGDIFARYAVDPDRVALVGFSDGASYALSIGLANGDLFKQIIAFSPGFIFPSGFRGQPRVFVSHGTDDAILQIDRASRTLVPVLRQLGCAVEYVEFEGSHTVPPDVLRTAYAWLTSGDSDAIEAMRAP